MTIIMTIMAMTTITAHFQRGHDHCSTDLHPDERGDAFAATWENIDEDDTPNVDPINLTQGEVYAVTSPFSTNSRTQQKM